MGSREEQELRVGSWPSLAAPISVKGSRYASSLISSKRFTECPPHKRHRRRSQRGQNRQPIKGEPQ